MVRSKSIDAACPQVILHPVYASFKAALSYIPLAQHPSNSGARQLRLRRNLTLSPTKYLNEGDETIAVQGVRLHFTRTFKAMSPMNNIKSDSRPAT